MDGPYTFPTHRLGHLDGQSLPSVCEIAPSAPSPLIFPRRGCQKVETVPARVSLRRSSVAAAPQTHRELTPHPLHAPAAGSDKTPLVLVACGSYSPVTFLHLRLFEMARDDATFNTQFHVIGGYLSPVNDRYRKLGLASAKHRVAMCDQAVDDTSDWLMVDPWEARQPRYLPTAQVLDHFDHELNTVRGGADVVVVDPRTGERRTEKRRVRIMLLAGSDLILTMSEPGVWAEKDVRLVVPPSSSRRARLPLTLSSALARSCTTFSASTACTSSSAPSRSSTRPSSRRRRSTRARPSPCTATTSTWSSRRCATTYRRPRSGSSSARA